MSLRSILLKALAVLAVLCVVCVHGQFFTKTDKAVPRLGRRMDPQMAQAVVSDVPISQEIQYPFNYLKVSNLADVRKWSPTSSLYEGYPARLSRLGRSVNNV
ncbi:hypothetical protein BV898_08048 [Hypsibius exemplaris]|uniref:Uncharacterized protein n=1 Tax=Hypsibius exemplaris TaxID=2072580 RepID=A0A1W0WRU9_HYPEX|nr:hypothetical protein BV898_08048 [Hypsibius exemplaris]